MLGPTHRLFGALCGATYASTTGQDFPTIVAVSIVATATSHGWSSPDLDQTEPWTTARKFLPGIREVMHHRGITHWWGLIPAAWMGVHAFIPAGDRWVFVALLIGWASHILGDAIFGKIPVFPWGGRHVGIGLDTGGVWETGRFELFGRSRKVIPFGPARLACSIGIVAVLVLTPAAPTINLPDLHDQFNRITTLEATP